MKIIVAGDIHISGRKPKARMDDFIDEQFNKLFQLVKLSNEHDCPIIFPGDFFEYPVVAESIVSLVGEIINHLKHPIYFVWGNHCTKHHSVELWDRTSLGVIASNNPKMKHISHFKNDYGIEWAYMDWGCDLINESGKAEFVLMHKAIYTNKMAGGNNSWISKDKTFGLNIQSPIFQSFKFLVCGHWHKQYAFKFKNKLVINSGVLIRHTVNDSQDPIVHLVDLDTLKFEVLKIQCKPFHEIMSSAHLDSRFTPSKSTQKLTEMLSMEKVEQKGMKFIDKLENMMKNGKLDKEVSNILREAIIRTRQFKKGEQDVNI